jgi:hypothetical protein
MKSKVPNLNVVSVAAFLAAIFFLGAFLSAQTFAEEVLPKPELRFKGKIGRTVKDSKSDFPKAIEEIVQRTARTRNWTGTLTQPAL